MRRKRKGIYYAPLFLIIKASEEGMKMMMKTKRKRIQGSAISWRTLQCKR